MFAALMALAWCGGPQPLRAQFAPLGRPKSPAAAAAQPPGPQTLRAAADRVDRLAAALQDVRQRIPRDSFDPAAVAARVGNDPARLFAWVRDRTDWVPYRGMLRGPAGVLMDGTGNALDRALLLQALLHAAGFRARLAHATLSTAQAADLARRIRRFAPPQPAATQPAAPDADAAEAIGREAKAFDLDPAELRQNFERVTSRGASRSQAWREALARQGELVSRATVAADARKPAAPAATLSDEQAESLRDHWWVQWRDHASAWADLDPAPAEASAGSVAVPNLAPNRTLDPDPAGAIHVPPADCQQVTIRVVIEQWSAGRLVEQRVIEHAIVPADLIGQRIAVQHLPLDWPTRETSKGTLAADAADAKRWLPVLRVGEATVAETGFTDAGTLIPKAWGGGLLRGAPGAGERVSGMLSGGIGRGDRSEANGRSNTVLTAEWIEYAFAIPGHRTQTIRRDVFDLIGPATRGGGGQIPTPRLDLATRAECGMALLGRISVTPMVGRISPEFLVHRNADRALAAREAFDALVKRLTSDGGRSGEDRANPPKPPPELDDVLAAVGGPEPTLTLAAARSAGLSSRPEVYLERPNLLDFVVGPVADPNRAGGTRVRAMFDVVNNDVQIRPGAPGDPRALRLAQGVADTVAEQMTLPGQSTGRAGGSTESTCSLFDAAAAQGVGTVLVRSRGDPQFQALTMTPDVRARAASDLGDGYALVLPERAVQLNGRERTGWWRVDLTTGQTLGVMDSGYHQTGSEKAGNEAEGGQRANSMRELIRRLRPYGSYPGRGLNAALDEAEAWLNQSEAEWAAREAANAAAMLRGDIFGGILVALMFGAIIGAGIWGWYDLGNFPEYSGPGADVPAAGGQRH